MRQFHHRTTAWIAGLAYLLAVALSGSLHSHSHGEPHTHDHACLSAAAVDGHSHHAADEHLAAHDEGEEAPSTPPPLSDEDCAACRFVAQSAVFSVLASDLTPVPLVAEVRVVAPSFFIEPVHSNRLARAPPLG